ncbi:glycoside hydrolase family 19 protein [Pseudomonas sp. YuFO20]|uniref:glycoside hydrolase family 19 protein n=1 Tax=Pseudomonas sp. YuFO20 TaxID=3095362 RepID=UPI002B24577A|nr:glycoside hydrolase family 19 protein [Pseudomonas sp. YuFO20]MEB2516419.1 glycoside hydrolase family 19 protein [Pseudomonas sp. YuFO20]
MAKLLDWIFGRHYDSTTPRSMPPVGPTREPQPISPTTAPKTDGLPPLKNWCHPFKDTRTPLQQLTHLANANAGYYPLGRNGLWHGGVHFDSGTAVGLKQSSVHCLADGEVVAYRIDTYSPTTTYFVNEEVEKTFSRNFVLVRHHLQPPTIQDSTETPPSLIFYSLYMHLQDWVMYDEDPTLARPGFWPEVHRVKATANDPHPDDPEQRGLHVYYRPRSGKVADFLPRGVEVVISGQGDYRRLKNRLGPASLSNDDGSLRGYIASRYLQSQVGGEHRIETRGDELNVRPEASLRNEAISKLPDGTIVTVSGEGDFRKLERLPQYVQFAGLQSVLEPLATDRIVVLDTPVAIKAGDLIGHVGLYQDGGASQPEKKLHLETFSGDDVEAFIDASRVWADRLPEKDRTWLKLAKGTPVVPPEGNITAAKLQVASASSPLSAADLLVPKKLLDDLPADRKIQVPATPTRKARTWYRLENLLHDANHNLLDGWVCEEPGVTTWVNPWVWEGYDVIIDYSRPKHLMASFLSAVARFTEAQRERYRPIAEKDDKGPMKSRLYEIIDRNRDGKMTATELQAALELPAHAQSISQMILYKESEWFHQPKIWDALDELLGHSGSTPHLNWLAEKQRIAEMGWWKEVTEQVGLPSWGSAYHFHPVGMMGHFSNSENGILNCKICGVTLKLTKDFLSEICGYEVDPLFINAMVEASKSLFNKYGVDSCEQVTHLLAQAKKETGGFVHFRESLNYSRRTYTAAKLYRLSPTVINAGFSRKGLSFTSDEEKLGWIDEHLIGNDAAYGLHCYGNANQPGKDFRGRGLIHLTHYETYKKCAKDTGLPIDSNPELLEKDFSVAIETALWFWKVRRIAAIAEDPSLNGDVSVTAVTRPINIGLAGLSERQKYKQEITKEFNTHFDSRCKRND